MRVRPGREESVVSGQAPAQIYLAGVCWLPAATRLTSSFLKMIPKPLTAPRTRNSLSTEASLFCVINSYSCSNCSNHHS